MFLAAGLMIEASKQRRSSSNLLEKEKHATAYRVLKNSFQPRFVSLFPLIKSEHDFNFRPWGESLGRVQTQWQRKKC